MSMNFLNFWQKRHLINLVISILLSKSALVHAFEHGPIIISPGPPNYYTTTPKSACEYKILTYRGTPYFPVPGASDADILSIGVIPSDQNGYPVSSGPASSYLCTAKILRIYGSTYNPPTQVIDINYAGWVYPVCNVGDSVGGVTGETICNTPDNIPDKGANLGHPPICNGIGNPINAATGNKYDQQIDVELSTGLSFSRYYNSNSLSGSSQIGSAWTHTFQRSLFINTATATATRSDGQLAYFRLIDSAWVNQQKGGDTLTQLSDGNGNSTSWRYINADDTTETYDTTGKLLSISNRDGRTQTLTYDVNGRLVTVTDDTGRALNFTYDGSNRISTLSNPAGGLLQYAYDTTGNLVSVTYPDGKTRTYHYNEPAYTSNTNLPYALTGITDENGTRYATYTYDTQGRAIITEHAGGADRHMLTYSADGSSTIITDPLGSQYTRQFQTILGVAKSSGQSQPAGAGCSAASSSISYDVNGNVASRTDFNGNKTCYAFDLNRNLETARVEGLAVGSICPDVIAYTPAANTAERKILTDWHASFRLPIRVTEAKRETSFTYDTHGNITQLSIKDTATNVSRSWSTSYVYHASIPSVVVQRTEDGPRTDVADITTIDYYAPDAACAGGHLGCRGQVFHVTNALGHVTQITRYNAHSQPEEIIDPNGLRTRLTYDVRQRLLSRSVGTEITQYQYDGIGQLKQITLPDNSTLNYSYDDANRLTGITDKLGNSIRYTLDAMGNHVKEEILDASNTLAKTQQQEFDALSRLWKITGAQNQTNQLGYDPNGNLTQITDALQHTTSNRFDALNRLTQSTDPAGGQTHQNHNALDKVTKVTDPKGIATSYTVNALGDITQEVSADRGITTYTYDEMGNFRTRTDARGVVQTMTYDALNRPATRSYNSVVGIPDTATTTWRYDEGVNGIGHLTGMSDESGSTTYQYDPQGRLISKTQTVRYDTESFTHTLSYQYDTSGRLSQTTYPSGARISMLYGIDGRPVEIHVNGNIVLQDITYHPFGAPKSWIWGNGQPHHRSFDLDGRLTQHPLGPDIQTITFDTANRIIGTNQTNPIYNRTYEYDSLDRLIRQTDNTSTRQWDYDANSNRIHEQSGSTIYPYTLDTASNRLLTVSGPVAKTYTYDAAGNPLTDGITDYTWNTAGRLTKSVAGNRVSVHLYNGLGERTLKIGSRSTRGGPYLYFYDSAGKLIGDYEKTKGAKQTTNWMQKQETIWLGDIPIAVIKQPVATEPAQIYFIHTDHLNTPRLIVDQTNTPVWRWDNQNAFGNNPPDEDPDGNRKLFEYNLRFAGQYFDTETNLHYNYFRDYESATGRYLTPDPIGLMGGLNTYGYVSSNPISKFDFFGLAEMCNVGLPISFGIPHTFLCANGSCSGYRPSGNPFFSDGIVSLDDLNYSKASCNDVPQKNCTKEELDSCISTFINNLGTTGDKYNFYANNCGQWATSVIMHCRSQCSQ